MRTHRKTTPKVKDGRVQKKNRHDLTPNYWNTRQKELQIDQEKPGKGYKHFLKKRDILNFLEILPNWEELQVELDAVILAAGGGEDGWYSNGVLAICAWEKDKTVSMNKAYFMEHQAIFERLHVPFEIKATGVVCHFSEDQIRAYQLLHIFLHELGHHHDRLSTHDRVDNAPRGEQYAENYALKYEQVIWNRFFEVFGMV
ncbi:hypothetical protein KFE98_14805 [bacterium SCSIO 12741]|nr:hypothetical protein KFE98_14805 [bacterium SCSIO 12741]